MTNMLLDFALQSAFCLTLLYGVWWLALRRETFFRLSRACLLTIVVLSAVIPLIHVTVTIDETQYREVVSQPAVGHIATYYADDYQDFCNSHSSWPAIIYTMGFVLMLLYKLVVICRLQFIIRHGLLWTQTEPSGITISCQAGERPSFSWMRQVIISESDYKYHPEVLQHELSHVRHLHSLDLLLVAVAECVQWFNPFIYLLARSLHDLHEYTADADTIACGVDPTQYQMLLISKAAGISQPLMVNAFAQHRLKERLQMMLRVPSATWRRSKALLLVPGIVLACLLVAPHLNVVKETLRKPASPARQSVPQPAVPKESSAPIETVEPAVTQQPKETVNETAAAEPVAEPATTEQSSPTVVSPTQMPQFPGGNAALRAFLAEHTSATDWSGQLFVSFIIGEDGGLSNIKLMRGGSDEANETVRQIVAAMPRWIPGRRNGKTVATQYVLPISF